MLDPPVWLPGFFISIAAGDKLEATGTFKVGPSTKAVVWKARPALPTVHGVQVRVTNALTRKSISTRTLGTRCLRVG